MGKPLTPDQRYRTASEQLIGRLTVLYKSNPERCADIIERMLKLSGIIGDAEVRKTYAIELKIDFDDEKRHKIMLHIARKMARQILTQASMIADNRQPQVALTCDDFFEGGSKEALMDLPEQHPEEDPGDGIVGEQDDQI